MLTLTNQPPATTGSSVTPPPFDTERGSTEMQLAPAMYNDGDIHMGNVNNSVTDGLYE